MIDSIFIALTGLRASEQGLRTISNDAANLDTPGFKSSSLQFADLFGAGGTGEDGGQTSGARGYGVSTLAAQFDFKQGQLQSTGNDLDLAVDGAGFFVLKDAEGNIRYTRDGQFSFNDDGLLVSTATGEQVMAYGTDGALGPVSIATLRQNAAKATANITFSGNLSSTATTDTVGSVTVIDSLGSTHTLSLKLDPVSGSLGTWTVTVLDGATTVGTGQIAFLNGQPAPGSSKVSVTYTPPGSQPLPLTLDFSTGVTSYDSGTQSTLAMATQDGHAAGALASTKFDGGGVLTLSYSDGQKVTGPRLALARFSSPDAIGSVGTNEFDATDPRAWQTGTAGADGFGSIRSDMVEGSNVDLSQEFSDLIVMQRGYQASSQVISTANDMIGDLFTMKGSR